VHQLKTIELQKTSSCQRSEEGLCWPSQAFGAQVIM